jgi:hypothetical protein
MRCPKHPEVWLYENMTEVKGYCPECDEWYDLKEVIE